MRVLVVEDNSTRAQFFMEILSEAQMAFATNSRDALKLLQKEDFDLIFLDLDLDDGLKQGLVVAQFIRKSINALSAVIVHSMNIAASGEVEKILPGTRLLPIAEMRRIIAAHGKEYLLEIILE